MRKGSLITHVHIQKLNPSTPKISLVILLNICDTIINNVSLENLVMDQLVIPTNIFIHSHHLSPS